jgi:hypothetical protein
MIVEPFSQYVLKMFCKLYDMCDGMTALDSLESSLSVEEIPAENRIKIINDLLGDYDEMKNIYFYT